MKILLWKTQRKTKKSKWKIWKSFWRRKSQKAKKAWERYQNLTEEERKDKDSNNRFEEEELKLVEYRRSYHLTQSE